MQLHATHVPYLVRSACLHPSGQRSVLTGPLVDANCRLLSNMNIQGTLPVQLRQLNELITLKLDGNK